MRTFGSGNVAYLYVNGLATPRPLLLSPSVELLPAEADCSAELFLALGKTDADISVISLFLPLAESQLKVIGENAKDTAIRTWNAMWDALLLGAITNSDVMCNLQSDVPAERLTPASLVSITNYQLRGLGTSPAHRLTDIEISWIETHFESARVLLDDDRYQNAVHCLATYHWHTVPRARLAIIWSGIEGLFEIDSELSFRVSLYCARFLVEHDRNKQAALFSETRELYKLRSKAVHGGRMKAEPQDGVRKSADLLRNLIMVCAERKALPAVEALAP